MVKKWIGARLLKKMNVSATILESEEEDLTTVTTLRYWIKIIWLLRKKNKSVKCILTDNTVFGQGEFTLSTSYSACIALYKWLLRVLVIINLRRMISTIILYYILSRLLYSFHNNENWPFKIKYWSELQWCISQQRSLPVIII